MSIFIQRISGFAASCLLTAAASSQPLSPQNVLMGDSPISITATGDVMLGTWVAPIIARRGVLYPFEPTLAHLQSSDIAIVNLEAPFTDDGELFDKKFNFKVPPQYARGLKVAGIDVVTLANNHIMDFGLTGLVNTLKTLDSVGVKYSGAGLNRDAAHQPVVLEAGGKKLAFFGYSMTFPTEFYAKADSPGTAYPESEQMAANVARWDTAVDYVVTSFHWSAEKLEIPKDYQIFMAHLAIDSGADLVLGHHPHVLQGLEIYKNKLIAYSLGNFAFGSYSGYAIDSIILKVHLNADGLFYAQCLPINVNNAEIEFQPQLYEGARKDSVIAKLKELSADLNGGRNIIEDSGLIFGSWSSLHDAAVNLAIRSN
jgi:poly-gamma-glutamate synthesis protein (capsule biosynthesis protein)